MTRITIAIDGFAGCGKSTTAKQAAEILGYTYIDSGAMYRAVTLYFLRHKVPFEVENIELQESLNHIHLEFVPSLLGKPEIHLSGENVEDEIRKPAVSNAVSPASVHRSVRAAMVRQQQAMGRLGGMVMDGRDIGTVVFPHAQLKVFLTADMGVRALRRQAELREKGTDVPLEEILTNLQERDRIDSTRAESPLRRAEDAIEVDTSHCTIEEQVAQVVALAKERILAANAIMAP